MELPEIKEIIFNFVTNLLQGNFQQGDISQFGSQKHTCVAFFIGCLRLTYLMGIRPYMDAKTGLVGAKRRIIHQSISEQLYVEPHQGIKSQSFSSAIWISTCWCY